MSSKEVEWEVGILPRVAIAEMRHEAHAPIIAIVTAMFPSSTILMETSNMRARKAKERTKK